jgi:hypothetical protein
MYVLSGSKQLTIFAKTQEQYNLFPNLKEISCLNLRTIRNEMWQDTNVATIRLRPSPVLPSIEFHRRRHLLFACLKKESVVTQRLERGTMLY